MQTEGTNSTHSIAKTVIMVRHSLPTIIPNLPAKEWRLSAIGRRRCIRLAERLRSHSPQVVVSSTEPKALETAQIVGELLDIPVETRERLHEHERPDVQFFEDRAEFEARVARFFAEPDRLVLGRETADQAHIRFSRAVENAVETHPSKTVAISTHGTVMTLLVTRANDLDPFSFWSQLGLPAFVILGLPGYKLASGIETVEDE